MTSWTKIAVIDSENGSAELYAYLGEYSVLTLDAPCTPEKYIEAIHLAERQGFDVIIIDSLSHAWNGEGGILDQGYIDWWNREGGGTVLKDWKTNRNPYQPTDNHQLGLYAWALRELTGANEVDGELVFLRYPFVITSKYQYKHTQQDMFDSREWALKLALEIEVKTAQVELVTEAGLFPDKPGVHCQYCGYSGLCIQSAKVEPIAIDNAVFARKVATDVIRLEAALADMKDKLKVWIKNNGDISVGDTVFSFVPSVSWSIGAEKLYELCMELHDAGIDVFQYLTLTAANLKKIGVGDDKLAAFGKKKTSQTFRLVKAKEAC